MKEQSSGERTLATIKAVIVFGIAGAFAFLTLFILEGIPGWVRILAVVIALLFGWALFFASPKARSEVMRWTPFP